MNEIDILLSSNLTGKFVVKQVFSDAMGKFPIGEINRYLYFDIRNALQHIVNSTFDSKGLSKDDSRLISYINSNLFRLSDYSTEATLNVPNRIELYSSSDYEQTYNSLSSFGAKVTSEIGLFSVRS